MTTKNLFCVACEHVGRDATGLYICDLPITDLITGETIPLGLPAGDERRWDNKRPGGCLPEGKNWSEANEAHS